MPHSAPRRSLVRRKVTARRARCGSSSEAISTRSLPTPRTTSFSKDFSARGNLSSRKYEVLCIKYNKIMKKDFDGWNKARKIIETNRWGCSFYAGVCTLSQQRESWEVLSLTPIERPLEYSMTECSSKTKLESVENGNTALASGASSIVPRTMLQRAELVGISVASGTWMSRRKRRACGKRPTEAGQGNRTPRARSDKL